MHAHAPTTQARWALPHDHARRRVPATEQPTPVFAGMALAVPLGLACWALLSWLALRLLG